MESENIYKDIATRTNGDIYVGVVGPVRVGKSTFISRFMEEFVIPKISGKNAKVCAIDELPQSADGKQIMTTQPKFVPAESVKIKIANAEMNIKMIDCVGYFVEGALGSEQDGKPRLVKTPWNSELMPLEEAAEFGTKKVITDHSTVAILMTTDGSFGDIERSKFQKAEERLVDELKTYQKPFVVVLNSKEPKAEKTQKLVTSLKNKYNVGVVALNATTMGEKEVNDVFENILNEFPLKSVELKLPNFVTALSFEDPIVQEVVQELLQNFGDLKKVGSLKDQVLFENSSKFEPMHMSKLELGKGKLLFDVVPKQNLFYDVLSKQCGIDIKDDLSLVVLMKNLAFAKTQYDKLKTALDDASQTGYGVVSPSVSDMTFDEPELVKQGSNRYGVKIKATAPSLHIMRVDVETEISPMIGSEEQSKDLIGYLNEQSNKTPNGMLNVNMFGKSMEQMMQEGLEGKLNKMPVEAQKKMRKTLTRIVNEGKGGIICILL